MMSGDPLGEHELLQAGIDEIEAIEPGLDEILGIQPQFDEGLVTEPDLDLDVPPEPSSPTDRRYREFIHTTTPFIVTLGRRLAPLTIDDPVHDDIRRGGGSVISASPTGIRVLLAVAIPAAAFLNGRMLMLVTGYSGGDAPTAVIPAIVSAAVVGVCWFRLRVTAGRGRR